ncbi:Phosphatidylinositol 3-/4-kinase [Macleaya cordata]|uniref:non-specific serine/threonine protein kinase n=1 Tax=Macleaya cordata TaxID=56857 RepID=A0A200Q3Y5_MACCD|nr:Phosphatidylinositol 3-/4-kinase [Macleaya cordata]
MQGLHHQQQQLAALLSVALPKDDSTTTTTTTTITTTTAVSSSSASAEEDDSARLAALNSLHRAILYPPNSLLVAHSSSFLSQGFSQLLLDKSYSVRRSAAIAYGALCAVVCPNPLTSNGRQNHAITGGSVDRFIGWGLPLLRDVVVGDGTVELALEGLREFLNVGDANGIERYVLPILKSCQELLEDERTSLNLLHQLLGFLTLISLKFARCFQPHFVDIVDLLLGWALIPDLQESDRSAIMDSFLQFRKHWLSNLQFSLGLLSKFLGDMDALLQDGSPGTPQQFRRLLALLSCFLTVLQVTASEMLEMNLLEQINEPLTRMLPQLLVCLSMVGKKFGWSKWIGESWRCLTLLAEILCENFSSFYPTAVDILFQSLGNDSATPPLASHKVPSLEVHGMLKTNLQLLSLQKLGVLPSSVQKILQFNSPISQLRLHPNHLVTGSCAATYLFLLQHVNTEVVEQGMTSVIEELELLKGMLGKIWDGEDQFRGITYSKPYSKLELFALIKFDLNVLLSCVSLCSGGGSLLSKPEIATSYNERSMKLTSFIFEKLNPFDSPIQGCVDLQVTVLRTLNKLSEVELLSKFATTKHSSKTASTGFAADRLLCQNGFKNGHSVVIIEYLRKYSTLLVKSMHASYPLTVKLEALQWVRSFCEVVIIANEDLNLISYFCEQGECIGVGSNLIFAVLDAASDRELKVRSHVASVLELLLQARLIYPGHFYSIAEVVLEKLGDPDIATKNAFMRVLSFVLPATIYSCGLIDYEISSTCEPGLLRLGNRSYLHWKKVFALKQLPQQLHSQQLISVLSYISQRWKVPLSSWIQRLIYSCHATKDFVSSQVDETGALVADGLWVDIKVEGNMLDKICSVNKLAAVWWCIHEAARYCITTRIRTNLGGPTQTFAALERMLLDIAHVLQLDSEQSDGNLNVGSSGAHLLPMRLLLDFVEALKKNVYNAYEGSSVLPCTSRQSSLFFRANKKVCEEWFSRICEPMMNAGLALQCQAATFHYCALRLQELQNQVTSSLKDKPRTQVSENLHNLRGRYAGDIMRVLRHAALALCRNHEPEALIGLKKWVTVTFSSLFMEDNQVIGHTGKIGPFSWITGLVYQAQGQYEKAAAYFAHLLQSEEALSSMGSDGVQFVIARVIDSYTALSDWKSLESWLSELQSLRARHAGKSYSGALTTAGNEVNALYALARFDQGDVQGAWAYLDLTPKSSSKLTLDPKLALQRSEQMLLQAMLLQSDGKVDKVQQEIEKAKLMLDEVLSVLPLDGLTETAPHATQLYSILAFEEGYKLRGSQEESKQLQSSLSLYDQVVKSPISSIRQDCNLWLKVFRVYRTVHPTSPSTLQLCQKLISLSRKQGNLMMAHHLSQYLKDHLSSFSEGRYHDLLLMNLQYEGILLMYAENKFEDAFTNLWSFLRSCMLYPDTLVSDAGMNALKAKACLKLSAWLRRDYSDMNLENVVFSMREDFNALNDCSVGTSGLSFSNENLASKPSFSVILEEIVGTATKLSSLLCPTMGKSWVSYASWCYSQARHSLSASCDTLLRSCSLSPILIPEIQPNRFQLTNGEISRVETIITKLFVSKRDANNLNCSGGERDVSPDSGEHLKNEDTVKALVQQVVKVIEAAHGAPGVEDCDVEGHSGTLTSQLQRSLLHMDDSLDETDIFSSVDELVEVWRSLRRRRVSLFGYAAHGFMQYLSHSSSKLWEGHLASPNIDSGRQKTESYTLRATLYVLNILLNYGVELKDTLETGLSTVPLLPWQEIIPQLFARLSSHPEQVVRKQLEGLLMMLAKLYPWSVVYPTLVDVNAYEGEPSEELQHILACLGKLYPKLIVDVQLVINQLGNVTVLWEELWLSTLQDLHADVIRRINMLKEEASRIAENLTLSHSEKNKINAAKYSAMMAPIVVALERRLASTSRKPETPHEIWFHKEYGEQLKSAILTFRTPPASAAALGDVWWPFDTIAASLASYQRKTSISLGDVAPQLALLSSSEVPMPGLEKQITTPESSGSSTIDLQRTVIITSFFEQMTILSTKTKPKKLAILGSDGQKYTYLLKGREDLRLDARIMQLLQAINGFLHSSPDTRSRSLAIRYYSVTPISGRAGLIQWVDNVISIYSVFKSWQNRAQLAQLSAMGAGKINSTVPPPVPRPSDMFYGKIIPALKEKGIRRVISRRDWPHEVKRKVLLDLMKETPRQLLHQEIWCASEGFKAFSSKLKRYSGSVAAMSMVGHILGLGDRHLDNILMDFCSGDVVHIDYNVCFDKGQRLKIPEIVPFRLTQMIEAALGFTGIEGTFRANCEAVVSVLRKNKDIILMLLEVFVWDPLVEWTRGDSHDEAAIGGEERKGMELAVSLSLFASRVQEIRVPLQEHHDLFLATLPAVEYALERFAEVLNQYEVVSAFFYRADQERSKLVLHEATAKSNVAEATCNSEKTRASFEIQAHEFAQVKTVSAEKAQEASMWVEQHGRVLDALRNGSIPEAQACIKLSGMEEALSLTSAVLVAGVPLTIVPEPTQAQCHDLDREVSELIAELDGGLSCAVKSLQAYALALQRTLPLNYITTSPVHGWAQVLQLSVNTLSSDTLSLARRQASDLIAKAQGDALDSIQRRYDDLCLIVEKYVVEIQKVEKECSELVNSIGSETEARAKDRLSSAFTKYVQSAGLSRKEDDVAFVQLGQVRHGITRESRLQGELEEKKEKVLSVLHVAARAIYNEVKGKILDSLNNSTGRVGWRHAEESLHTDSGTICCEFEEQIEKCMLVAGYINEIRHFIDMDVPSTDIDPVKYSTEGNWASIFQAALLSCRILVGKMTEVVLPEIIRSVVSYNSEVMDAFGSLSQIRGSIDMALEQRVEVELERASLIELEQNYFVKVGLITEQQLALEEAALKGRDHLSWEEAEELASQEEACRAQLDQLHQTWNQKDMRSSSLIKREISIRNALVSSERCFLSLISDEQGNDPHILRSKALLDTLAGPFSELESIDKMLSSFGAHVASYLNGSPNVVDLMTSGYSISELVWKFSSLLNNHCFYIWKVGIMDSFLDSCIHDISSSVDHNLGFDQLYNVLKKKLETQLQEHIGQYLRERVAPALLACLEQENEHLKTLTEGAKELSSDQLKREVEAVKKVQLMLEEYCNAHETARAARSAASLMARQVSELKEALRKTILEIVQMEWLHNISLPYLHKNRVISQNFLGSDDNLYPLILNLNRSKLLENIQSSVSSIARSVEGLQACERTSVSAEGQLERAMGWACGGPNPSGNTSVKSSGIPPEFHNHLMRRRQLLWTAREQASDIIGVCTSILEFEASRDGIFLVPGEISIGRSTGDRRNWQQTYINILSRLDVTYHSFTRAEQEWKLAQSSMEAAANGLFSATNELSIVSAKAKSASGDLQGTLSAMWDCAYQASVALSAFGRVTRGHTALTSECGSMLEEVLAITEGLHDVHSLGKEAAAIHNALMADLSKANMILVPLESVLSKDVAAMNDAISRDRESNVEIPLIHGQAIYQSYFLKLREACQLLKPLVPSLTFSVKELHSMLMKLARTASIHAGNLHKALEGLGESQAVRSQEVSFPRSDLTDDAAIFDNKNDLLPGTDRSCSPECLDVSGFSLQDEGWISPPDSIYGSSSESDGTSAETSFPENINGQANVTERVSHEFSCSGGADCLNIQEFSLNEQSESQYLGVNNSVTSTHDEPIKYQQPFALADVKETTADIDPLHPLDKEMAEEVNFDGKDETTMLNQGKGKTRNREAPSPFVDVATRITRSKNPYALSVLRRVDMKLDGRDIENDREISIAEQVDYLLKQATSVDNLCNMYEGWTPWI